MLDDYVDVCYRMIEGNLKGIRFSNKASVVTCAVPQNYGTGVPVVEGGIVNLDRAFAMERERHDRSLRVFPMDVRLKDGKTRMGSSRTVAIAGIGKSIEEARDNSLQGIRTVDAPMRYRTDVASAADIEWSAHHLRKLRARRTQASAI
jgi:phosphoribosylamine--glycine ligase